MQVGGKEFKKWWGKGNPQLMDVDGNNAPLKDVLENIQSQIGTASVRPIPVGDIQYFEDSPEAIVISKSIQTPGSII